MAKMAELTASDGGPARDSGEWAQEKLWYVARYMGTFNTGQKFNWPERAYVDLMAGPGVCVVPGTAVEFDGSPLLALRCRTPFTKAIFVDISERNCWALTLRSSMPDCRPEPIVIPGDCNDPKIIARIRAEVTPRALGFCFIDLLGLDVAFSTIRDLTRNRRIDLVVTFPELDVTRNAPRTADDSAEAARWDRFFGDPGWRTVLEQKRQRERADSVAVEIARFYGARLETLGYNVLLHPETMKNTCNAALYRPIFASKHGRGTDYWKKISAIDFHRQGHLFE